MSEFKVGDIVEAFGLRGEVTRSGDLYIYVSFPEGRGAQFLLDGREENWHTEPSLKLISRPSKKVKKVFYQAVVSSGIQRNYFLSDGLFQNSKDAENYLEPVGFIFIRLLTENPIEIEVEE